jgi:hypothetical protein
MCSLIEQLSATSTSYRVWLAMSNHSFATVRVHQSDERAPKEVERLFANLELFVNFGDSFADYSAVVKKCPSFCPMSMRNNEGNVLNLLSNESCQELAKVFRDYLRLVWSRDRVAMDEQILKILMGLEHNVMRHARFEEQFESRPIMLGLVKWTEELERRSESMFSDFTPRLRRALMLMREERETRFYRPFSPLLIADWERGDFSYEPANDFQRATYKLFRESWRARKCRECQKFFIASRHPRMYCSVGCSGIARRKRDLALWKERGSGLRQKRNRRNVRTRRR